MVTARPCTKHGSAIVAGHEPALILAVGARVQRGSARYPVDRAAIRHGAAVPDPSVAPAEVYARFGAPRSGPAPAIFGP
jgi:hypothetical protein